MRKNRVVLKVSKFLNKSFNDVFPSFKFLSSRIDDIRVITTDDIDTVARELICREWHHKNRTPLWDEILWTSNFCVTGLDFQDIKERKYVKSFFLVDKELIIVKRETVRINFGLLDDTYSVVVYKPCNHLPEKSQYFDTKRQYGFHLKYWDTVKPLQ